MRTAGLRSRTMRVAATVGVVLSVGGTSVAFAIPPGGVKENPGGAVVTVSPSDVPVGGKVLFTGTGFSAGEAVSVKIDDEGIFKKGTTNDVLTEVTAAGDGTLSGSIDLSQLNPATPVGPGAHWVRLLSSKPRSLRSDFTVSAAPAATPAPGATPAPAAPGATPAPAAPGSAAPTPTPRPTVSPKLVEVTATTITVKRSKATVKLTAGVNGSAGRMRVRTLEKFKIGKGASKRRDVFKAEDYLVEKLGRASIRVALTSDGKAVLKRRKAFKAVAEITDATGDKVKQTITVRR